MGIKNRMASIVAVADNIIEYESDYKLNRTKLIASLLWWRYVHGVPIKYYRHYRFQRLSSYERKKYFHGFDLKKFLKKVNDQERSKYLNEKDNFYREFRDYLGRDTLVLEDVDYDEYRSFLEKHGRVLAKPVSGAEGKGIIFLDKESGDSASRFDELKAKGFVLDQIVSQCKELADFNESSLNTIRVHTFRNNKNEVEVLGCSLKLGARGLQLMILMRVGLWLQ